LQVEAARQAISKGIGRGRLWIRVSPESLVSTGDALFELDGVDEVVAREALRRGGSELPLACDVFRKG
jgi:large subunit ribosomal protein L16